ncbi:hypothetical protein [Tolypothrix tenuis]
MNLEIANSLLLCFAIALENSSLTGELNRQNFTSIVCKTYQ